jgi:hypothetical protein
VTTVLPISAQQHRTLSARYGTEALPDYECEALCMRTVTVVPNGVGCGSGGSAGSAGSDGAGGAGGAGATAGAGGAGAAGEGGAGGAATGGQGTGGTPSWCAPNELEQFVSITECTLTTVEWVEPAVICTGSLPCYG